MNVLGISGSPRREGNTDILVNAALEVLAGEGLQTFCGAFSYVASSTIFRRSLDSAVLDAT